MHTKDFRQFSVKVKAPWWVLFRHSYDLKEVFLEKLKGYMGQNFRVTVRAFKNSLMCRFTVIFDCPPMHPDSIESLIERVARMTMVSIIADKTKNK